MRGWFYFFIIPILALALVSCIAQERTKLIVHTAGSLMILFTKLRKNLRKFTHPLILKLRGTGAFR